MFTVFSKSLGENAAQASLIKVILLKGVQISRQKVQNVTYWSHYFDLLSFMKKAKRSRNNEMKLVP